MSSLGESIHQRTRGNYGDAPRRDFQEQPVTRDQLCRRFTGEQRPQVVVSRVQSAGDGIGLTPNGVCNQLREQPVNGVWGEPMGPDNRRSTQYGRVFVE